MIENINYLLLQAYQDAGVIGLADQMQGFHTSYGLSLLNMIIKSLSTNGNTIPYNTELDFNIQVNKAEYSVDLQLGSDISSPPIVAINFCSILIGSVWHPLRVDNAGYYYKKDRVSDDHLSSVPQEVLLIKGTNTSLLVFYPPASIVYPCRLQGLFQMPVLVGTELLSSFPECYQMYLRYDLRVKFEQNIRKVSVDPDVLKDREKLFKIIQNNSPVDVTPDPAPFFMQENGGVPKPIQTLGY